MKIAVLGWGSLIWRPESLSIQGSWQTNGPILPIELSRVSDNGRLTFVIDEGNGVDVPTSYALSAITDLTLAMINLQEREGTQNLNRIGFVNLRESKSCIRAQGQHPIACKRIEEWAQLHGMDAVIWTALGPRFEQKTGEPFSVDAAVRYVASLAGTVRQSALEYIHNAPLETTTPVRKALELKFPAVGGASPR